MLSNIYYHTYYDDKENHRCPGPGCPTHGGDYCYPGVFASYPTGLVERQTLSPELILSTFERPTTASLGKDELLRPLVLLWIFQCVLSNIVKGRL
jgi:hypothetical protein